MIFGREIRAGGIAVWSVILLCVTGNETAIAQAPWGLPQLMAELARVKSESAQFTERKTSRLLTEPMTLSGRLAYTAPSHIEKITLSPMPESLVMDGDRVTIVTGANHDNHTFSVADYPQIGGLVEGIRATLAGDQRALDRFYTVSLGGTPAAWNLLLIPHDPDVARFIKSIDFRGSGDRIQTIDTEDADGERSDMNIFADRQDAQ